jgi:hypothetical protein
MQMCQDASLGCIQMNEIMHLIDHLFQKIGLVPTKTNHTQDEIIFSMGKIFNLHGKYIL